MIDKRHIKLLTGLLLSVLATPVYAETAYVTDSCEITLRSGQSTGHKVLRMLRSGMALEVLETNPDSGYTNVRTRSGKEGWSLTRLLDKQPNAKQRLEKANKQIETLSKSKGETGKLLKTLTSERDELQSKVTVLERDNKALSSELGGIRKTAANTLSIFANNKKLKEQIVEMERELQAIQLEAEDLRDKSARDWFMSGAGVIVLGILIGVIAPRIRLRRKTSWDSF